LAAVGAHGVRPRQRAQGLAPLAAERSLELTAYLLGAYGVAP